MRHLPFVGAVLSQPARTAFVTYSFVFPPRDFASRATSPPHPIAMLTPTGFAPSREDSAPIAIEAMLARARSLYTLPAVAAEVIQLTSNPTVEPQALKECIIRDPALTAKILRVVNSSLFGLPGEVCDLNQAIALLGTKPLKILVLGFSLPDNMFAGVAREQLRWYWTTTLTRAVAAREISEQLFKAPGDEAFLAGLLQGLGVLVLAKQLGPTYAAMLHRAIDTGVDLRELEQEALDFDHIQLTAAMLEHWNMPRQLVGAIASQHDAKALSQDHRLNMPLARILYLANLLAELVGQHRLSVLPDLLEAGATYCDLDNANLHELIVSLQPKVNHLAEVLSLEVGDTIDYVQILIAAHDRMSDLTESVFFHEPATAVTLAEPKLRSTDCLLDETVQLRAAMDRFLRPMNKTVDAKPAPNSTNSETKPSSGAVPPRLPALAENWKDQFVDWITLIAGTCRSRRQALSVVLVDIADLSTHPESDSVLSRLLDAACGTELPESALVEVNSAVRRTLILPAFDRQQAVTLAYDLIRNVELSARSERPFPGVISVGIASVTLPSKSFRPIELLHTAERCLTAARASETSVIKSLEIY